MIECVWSAKKQAVSISVIAYTNNTIRDFVKETSEVDLIGKGVLVAVPRTTLRERGKRVPKPKDDSQFVKS